MQLLRCRWLLFSVTCMVVGGFALAPLFRPSAPADYAAQPLRFYNFILNLVVGLAHFEQSNAPVLPIDVIAQGLQ